MKKPLTLLFLSTALAGASLQAQTPSPYPCLDSEVRRHFDFWLGEWEVFAGDQKAGESSITLAEGGCAIHESYTTAKGYSGQSINYYDPIAKKWRQNWVGSSGDVGIYEETDSRTKGSMQFIARQMDARGAIQLNRMTFTYDPNADTVRQFIEGSSDEGQTWTHSFDGLYKRKK